MCFRKRLRTPISALEPDHCIGERILKATDRQKMTVEIISADLCEQVWTTNLDYSMPNGIMDVDQLIIWEHRPLVSHDREETVHHLSGEYRIRPKVTVIKHWPMLKRIVSNSLKQHILSSHGKTCGRNSVQLIF